MKRDFKIRLGMGNPDFLPDYIDQLIEVFNDPRMFKFLHIPIQSGSDEVLKEMKRNYTVKTVKNVIDKIRKTHPDMTIATDIIVGHPNESEEDFNKTIDLMRAIKPDVINISRFWARPRTLASKKKQLPTKTIKIRGQIMTKTYHEIALKQNQKWLDWEGKILIDEIGKNNSYVGRNYAYKPVIVKGNYKIGEELKIKINKVTTFDLRAY